MWTLVCWIFLQSRTSKVDGTHDGVDDILANGQNYQNYEHLAYAQLSFNNSISLLVALVYVKVSAILFR